MGASAATQSVLQNQNLYAAARMLEYRGMEHTVPADMLLATAWRDWLFAQHKR